MNSSRRRQDSRPHSRTNLTSRDKGDIPVPMAGFPHHQLDGYLAKLIRGGYRVAVCEQMEDPKQAKGIVRREVTRIVTPGTLTDDALLDPLAPNLLVAISVAHPGQRGNRSIDQTCFNEAAAAAIQPIGIAWVELSTGRFEAGVFSSDRLIDELARLEPAEVLVRDDDGSLQRERESPREHPGRYLIGRLGNSDSRKPHEFCCEHFGILDLASMGWKREMNWRSAQPVPPWPIYRKRRRIRSSISGS